MDPSAQGRASCSGFTRARGFRPSCRPRHQLQLGTSGRRKQELAKKARAVFYMPAYKNRGQKPTRRPSRPGPGLLLGFYPGARLPAKSPSKVSDAARHVWKKKARAGQKGEKERGTDMQKDKSPGRRRVNSTARGAPSPQRIEGRARRKPRRDGAQGNAFYPI